MNIRLHPADHSETTEWLVQSIDDLLQAQRIDEASRLVRRSAKAVVHQLSLDDARVAAVVEKCLLTEQSGALAAVLQTLLGGGKISVAFSAKASRDPSVVRCSFLGRGRFKLTFRNDMLGMAAADRDALATVTRYLLPTLPLLANYAASHLSAGSLNLNLGDEAHVRGVAFSGRTPDTTLIPDPDFLRGRGYMDLAIHFDQFPVLWSQRRPQALWRGSSTGRRDGLPLATLDRIRLCCHPAARGLHPLIDAGLTSAIQVTSQERLELETMGIKKDYIPPTRLQEWKYHIDIDGNSNAWSSTFQKLLCGSVLLKVASAGMWRQWYYERLVPFQNFVPVAADLSDLEEKLKFLINNDTIAEQIGFRGRSLALSLRFNSEVDSSLNSIEHAIMYDMMM